MIEDPDVIFVDFDDLFDAQSFDTGNTDKSLDYGDQANSQFDPWHVTGCPPDFAKQFNTDTAGYHHAMTKGVQYALPPPGYPLPYPTACYYPHPLHPTVFYPPGSIGTMNPYGIHSMDPSMYSVMPQGLNSSLATSAPAAININAEEAQDQSKTVHRIRTGSIESQDSLKNSAVVPPAPATQNQTKSSPKIRKKETIVVPPPPANDSPLVGETGESYSGKAITKEQFYKMRPKVPKISKSDPRRLYASAFGDAYNSCDFDKIWEFISTYCTRDVLFIHRWVGGELYLNFPKYLEVRGIESVAEYWFSRCLVAPDLVLENKETKLYVRSDGISTVLSSFTIVCTRLYDGEVSDSIICKAPTPNNDSSFAGPASLDSVKSLSSEEGNIDDSALISNNKPEDICNRVFQKVNRILSNVEPPPKRRALNPPRIEAEEDSFVTISSASTTSAPVETQSSMTSSAKVNNRKRMPKDQSITLLGTVTLHLNVDFKIRQIELNFALQQ